MTESLCLLKPDVYERNLTQNIIEDIQNAGFEVTNFVQRVLTVKDIEVLYFESLEQPYFRDLIDYMRSGISTFFLVKSEDAVNRLNNLVGSTDPRLSASNTLRKRYGLNILRNSIHSSNSNRLQFEINQLYNIKKRNELITFPEYFRLKNGIICHTVSENCYEDGMLIGVPKYFRVEKNYAGSRLIDGEYYVRNGSIDESILYAKLFTDIKIKKTKTFGEELCIFSNDEIDKVYKPFEKAVELLDYSGDVSILRDASQLLNIMIEEIGIPICDIGIEGSILLNGAQENSDLDIIIKGTESREKLNSRFFELKNNQGIHLYDENNIELIFSRRKKYHSFADKIEMLQQERRRTVGLLNGRRFWMQPIMGNNSLDFQQRDLQNIGLIECDGIITNDTNSFLWPTYYTLASKVFGETKIECYDPIYMNQVKLGDEVHIRAPMYYDSVSKQKIIIFSPWNNDVQVFKKLYSKRD